MHICMKLRAWRPRARDADSGGRKTTAVRRYRYECLAVASRGATMTRGAGPARTGAETLRCMYSDQCTVYAHAHAHAQVTHFTVRTTVYAYTAMVPWGPTGNFVFESVRAQRLM